jgi:uncharacterized protein (DUF2062 family)
MLKKSIKRIMPDHQMIRNHKHLRIFGALLHDPNLWHLNRRSVAGAFAVGLFMAFVPVPFQMVLAAAAAIVVRVNLPLSVVLVWITNPLTMAPMFYGTYKLGAWLLNRTPHHFEFQLTFEWLGHELGSIWQPFLLGCFVAGLASAILGYTVIRLLWRWHIVRAYQERRRKRGGAKAEGITSK